VLVERGYGYVLEKQRVKSDGTCPDCGAKISGIWK
jgi:hypothetical protein